MAWLNLFATYLFLSQTYKRKLRVNNFFLNLFSKEKKLLSSGKSNVCFPLFVFVLWHEKWNPFFPFSWSKQHLFLDRTLLRLRLERLVLRLPKGNDKTNHACSFIFSLRQPRLFFSK